MLASFNFSAPDTEPAYDTYRQMALRNLEADPFSQIGFGLFLKQELGVKYFLSTSNSISLVLFNEIHTAKWIGTFQEKCEVFLIRGICIFNLNVLIVLVCFALCRTKRTSGSSSGVGR